MTETAERLAGFFWDQLPQRVARWWPGLGNVMTDGRYLKGWPIAGAALPVIAFLAGFATGGFRPVSDEIFTMSIAWPVVLLAFGALGAGVGLFAWLGFVVGDLFVFPHISWETSLPAHLLKETLPLLILYEVLLGVAVLLPLAAASLPSTISRPLEGLIKPPAARFGLSLLLADAVAAATALSWSASVQLLIRPLATFHDAILPPPAVQTMRGEGVVFVGVAVIVTTIRVLAEAWLRRRNLRPEPIDLGDPKQRTWPYRLLTTFGVSLLIALGLTGLLDSPYDLGQDLILFGAVFGSSLLRTFVIPELRAYVRLIERVPVLVRILAIGAVGGFIGQFVLSATSLQGYLQISFLPILITGAIGLLLAGILIPAVPPPAEESK